MKTDRDIQFHYISTTENPADIASRGASAHDLQHSMLWWHGPDWMVKTRDTWPVWKYEDNGDKSEEIEAKPESVLNKEGVLFETKLVAGEDHSETMNKISNAPFGLDPQRFSSVTRLWRVTALSLRFVSKMRKKSTQNGPLKADEIESAEILWTKYIQRQQYRDIVDSTGKSNNLQVQLGIYMDSNGLLRCRGRLENAELCENSKHPILLPKGHTYTDLIVERYHKASLHTGISQTLSIVRHRYWIPQGRSVVRKVLRSCRVCRRHESGPYRMPLMPPLPAERVSESPPITYTGVDYFGPLYIKVNRNREKVWVCLYTCLVTRAVHLEMMHDMTTQQFLLGFRRFVARHGKPKKVISDNAAQFKLASDTIYKLWGEVLTENDVVSYAANQNILWEFNVELAPWMGGVYERLVGMVKRSLRKSLGKACLTSEQLLTLLKEAEAVINSRPLTYVGDDISSFEILTPAHSLSLNPKVGLPALIQDNTTDTDYNPQATSADKLVTIWKKGLKHIDNFWKVWREDYVLSLRERSQRKLKGPRVQSPFNANVGDVILIKDDLPRGQWRIGRIQGLNTSRDGHIRSAEVLLPSKKIICRPLSLLYPIECQEKEADTNTRTDNSSSAQNEHGMKKSKPDQTAPRLLRPKRLAAVKAQQRFSEQL